MFDTHSWNARTSKTNKQERSLLQSKTSTSLAIETQTVMVVREEPRARAFFPLSTSSKTVSRTVTLQAHITASSASEQSLELIRQT